MHLLQASIALFLFISLSHQQFWYAGNTAMVGTPQAAAVVTGSSNCSLRAYSTGYLNFSITVSNAGLYYVTALYERSHVLTAQIQVYNGNFDPSNACASLLGAYPAQNKVPHTQFMIYFNPGVYTFVVTGSNATAQGLFAIHVDAATTNVNTLSSGNYWFAPVAYDGVSCTASSSKASYVSFTITPSTSAIYDLLFLAYNASATVTWGFSVAIYVGTPTFLGTGTFAAPANPCTANFGYGRTDGLTDQNLYLQSGRPYTGTVALLQLSAGVTYTVVISTMDSTIKFGRFGLIQSFTNLKTVGNVANYVAPFVPPLGTIDICRPGNQSKYYGTNRFVAQYNIYVIDTSNDFFDAYGCLYSNVTTTPPATCPLNQFIQCGDVGDLGPVASYTNIGENYTWVEFARTGTGDSGDFYEPFIYGGTLLGQLPAVTTGALTSSEVTSESLTSNDATTGIDVTTGSVADVTTGSVADVTTGEVAVTTGSVADVTTGEDATTSESGITTDESTTEGESSENFSDAYRLVFSAFAFILFLI